MSIRIGTSGYSYDAWKGGFYPRGTRAGAQLAFYATSFPVVELNHTYYGMPTPEGMQRMVDRVPAGFEFTVKTHQDLTHAGQLLPRSCAEFRAAMQPLLDAGMLGCVLAQFPQSFRADRVNHNYLGELRDHLPDLPLVVEFRNAEWVSGETFDRLRELEIGFCCVDEPPLPGLMPGVIEATSPIGYIRFHGRNSEKWHRHQHASERYDYLYRREELEEWIPGVQQVAARTDVTYVFFNNCHSDQAPRNAWMMADLLEVALPRSGPAQPSLFDD